MTEHSVPEVKAPRFSWRALLQLARPKHWLKNGFVLAPLIFAGQFSHLDAVLESLLAFVLFCLASSAAYIFNDIRDVEADRRHPIKRLKRPLAAGTVSMRQAILALGCMYAVIVMAMFWVPKIAVVVVGYLLLNLAYSFWLKHQPVLDIFTIAAGFVLRVTAGSHALDVPVSGWMLVTTLCLALYLAAIKRRQELAHSGDDARRVLKNYSVQLVERYAEISSAGAMIFYSLFVMTARPTMIYTIPLVLFGLFRYWYVVDQLDAGESPTDVLIEDKPIAITVLAWVLLVVWALWPEVTA